MLENPCVFVEEKHGVKAGGEGWIDVAFGAVADHPAGVRREFVARDDCAVGRRVLFGDDFDRRRNALRVLSGATLSACSAWSPFVMRMRR